MEPDCNVKLQEHVYGGSFCQCAKQLMECCLKSISYVVMLLVMLPAPVHTAVILGVCARWMRLIRESIGDCTQIPST
jgi:hypothetical protein